MNLNGNSTAVRLLDFMETNDGMWFTTDNLASEFPQVAKRTVQRAVTSLATQQLVQTRQMDLPTDWCHNPKQSFRLSTQFRVPNRDYLDKVWG